jgi:hypothetical protein
MNLLNRNYDMKMSAFWSVRTIWILVFIKYAHVFRPDCTVLKVLSVHEIQFELAYEWMNEWMNEWNLNWFLSYTKSDRRFTPPGIYWAIPIIIHTHPPPPPPPPPLEFQNLDAPFPGISMVNTPFPLEIPRFLDRGVWIIVGIAHYLYVSQGRRQAFSQNPKEAVQFWYNDASTVGCRENVPLGNLWSLGLLIKQYNLEVYVTSCQYLFSLLKLIQESQGALWDLCCYSTRFTIKSVRILKIKAISFQIY